MVPPAFEALVLMVIKVSPGKLIQLWVKSPFFMGKLTISTGPFSIATTCRMYVSLPEGSALQDLHLGHADIDCAMLACGQCDMRETCEAPAAA